MDAYAIAECQMVFKAAGHADWTIKPEGDEERQFIGQYVVLNRNGSAIIVFGNMYDGNPGWKAYFCSKTMYKRTPTLIALKPYPTAGPMESLLNMAGRPRTWTMVTDEQKQNLRNALDASNCENWSIVYKEGILLAVDPHGVACRAIPKDEDCTIWHLVRPDPADQEAP